MSLKEIRLANGSDDKAMMNLLNEIYYLKLTTEDFNIIKNFVLTNTNEKLVVAQTFLRNILCTDNFLVDIGFIIDPIIFEDLFEDFDFVKFNDSINIALNSYVKRNIDENILIEEE